MRRNDAAAIAAVKKFPGYIQMAGGLDVMTPPYERKPGTCRLEQNFEASIFGGYRRIAGYERFDGHTKPSTGTFTIIAATITGAPSVGDTLTGATSGATGQIISLPGGSFVLTKVTGTFQDAEDLQVSAATVATATSAPAVGSASTAQLTAQYLNAAADVYRADISAVPGSGKILGVVLFNDIVYAFRNNAGGTAAAIYKSSATGWTAVSLGFQVTFNTGAAALVEGATVTGATSGASAVIARVRLDSGSLAGVTGVGTLIFASITGGPFTTGENLQVGGVTKGVAVADSAAITLLPDGRYEFVIANFTGSIGTLRVYGCDGVNPGFEFDGTVFVPISTGMSTDTPNHLIDHKYHLFFSFGPSVQYSSAGFPYQWTPVTGANEIAMGDNVTGFARIPGSAAGAALLISVQNRISILYGSGSADFNLVPYRDEIGAYAYTLQTMARNVFLDDQGITDFATTQDYGNFVTASLSNAVRSTITSYRTLAVSSCICRDLSQYRIFFTNSYGFYVTMSGSRVVGIMPVLFPNIVRTMWSGRMTDKSEAIFFGSDDGYIYQMEKGTSFDGAAIEAYIYLSYNFFKSPRQNKRYHDCALEMTGTGYSEVSLGYSIGYGDPLIPQPDSFALSNDFASTFWDAFTWDAFFWDGLQTLPSVVTLEGEGENISLAIVSNDDYFAPFTVSSALLHYSPRRALR